MPSDSTDLRLCCEVLADRYGLKRRSADDRDGELTHAESLAAVNVSCECPVIAKLLPYGLTYGIGDGQVHSVPEPGRESITAVSTNASAHV